MLTSSDVLNEVALIFRVPVVDIKAKNRHDEVVFCRKIFLFVCVTHFKISMAQLSRMLNRDSSYCKKEMKIINREVINNKSKWVEAWNKYQKESKIWQHIKNK